MAHALVLLCRFNGHCVQFYSVAQHSILVSTLYPPDQALTGLLHDAAEAYLGDLPTPVKRRLPKFIRAEQQAEVAIANAFGLASIISPDVKKAYTEALQIEKFRLLKHVGMEPDPSFSCLTWRDAEAAFLQRFAELKVT